MTKTGPARSYDNSALHELGKLFVSTFGELLFKLEQTIRFGFTLQPFQDRLRIFNSQILIIREAVIGGSLQLRAKPVDKWLTLHWDARLFAEKRDFTPELIFRHQLSATIAEMVTAWYTKVAGLQFEHYVVYWFSVNWKKLGRLLMSGCRCFGYV
jgi:hypothetical protein